ncbi:MAG TPA: TonB-dependent receptor [Burkholderiales bacterium]|nr:TonB-dependent receptor [Burkholderiales bacterium]
MQRHFISVAAAAATLAFASSPARAVSDAELADIRGQLQQVKEQYQSRLDALEKRLADAEARAARAEEKAGRAEATAATATQAETHARGAASAFNPEVSLILQGTYSNLSQDPGTYEITGFIPSGGEIGPPPRSFSVGESELVISASVDPWFRGQFTAALTPENEVEVEEAFIQTLALGHGFGLKAGRFFSGIGYINEQHPHSWDFVDAPLAQRAFLGGSNYGDDGVQLKWLAPAPFFLELGAEAGRGKDFPGSDRDKNGINSSAFFVHVGGDAGASHSWRAGLSYLRSTPVDRGYEDLDSTGVPVANAFSGSSKLLIADLVWKWAPNGDPRDRNFKLQGEYYRRKESGTLSFDTLDLSGFGSQSGGYDAEQSGWYLQGVYQFMPRWRVGLRYDRLDSGDVTNDMVLFNTGGLTAADFPGLAPHDPDRLTAMLDYSFSEFSRLRLQYARDDARLNAGDDQFFVQYIMSLGAHGAHKW